MTKLLLIGNGKWGQNYVSTLANFQNTSLSIANRHNWKELINQKPDGIIIATPPQSHIEIASYSLSHNIPTMIEKPLSLSLKEAEILKQYSAPILVNHSWLFSAKYQLVKQSIISENIELINTCGGSNAPQRDYSELWDYGPHDIAMILDLTQKMPLSIKCRETGPRWFEIYLDFGTFTSISSVGHSQYGKIRALNVSDGNTTYDCENMLSGSSDFPLTNALRVFIGAICGKLDYRLGLVLSLNVLNVLEKCQEQLLIQHIGS